MLEEMEEPEMELEPPEEAGYDHFWLVLPLAGHRRLRACRSHVCWCRSGWMKVMMITKVLQSEGLQREDASVGNLYNTLSFQSGIIMFVVC